MRRTVLVGAVIAVVAVEACQPVKSGPRISNPHGLAFTAFSTSKTPDFDSEIKPIFQARCQPCHFQGGKVYAEMPFDKPETIMRLGSKLFTRIKDEKEQKLIREFLDRQ